jgi:hypothetical protein
MRRLFLPLAFAMLLRADAVVSEGEVGGVKLKSVRVAPGHFNQSYLEHLGLAELAKSRSSFLQLCVYGSAGGYPLPKPDHFTFDHWRELYDAASTSKNEFAEVIAIGGNAVLRVHDGGGGVTRKVLAGRDPLQIDIANNRFEILNFSFGSTSPAVSRWVAVSVRTAAPLELESGEQLFQRLEPILANFLLTVSLRNDAWFIYDGGYPFYNPFVEYPAPPTADEYNKTRTLTCSRASRPLCVLR